MKNNGLHAQVATILELMREDIVINGWNERHDDIIKKIVEDLMFVHEKYEASFKPKTKKQRNL